MYKNKNQVIKFLGILSELQILFFFLLILMLALRPKSYLPNPQKDEYM